MNIDLKRLGNEKLFDSWKAYSRVYRGTLTSTKITKDGHILLSMTGCIKVIFGDEIYPKPARHSDMNFLVPKRKERVFMKATTLEIGMSIQVMLDRESRSRKLTVSEIDTENVNLSLIENEVGV